MRARSVLFIPGHKTEWLEKEYEADVVCVDLEDSVPEEFHLAALVNARRYMERHPNCWVRLRYMEDLTNLPRGMFVLPKLQYPEEVWWYETSAVTGSRFVVMIETALAVENAFLLAKRASVLGLLFGPYDLAADMGCDVRYVDAVRFRVVQAARAAGVLCWDGPGYCDSFQMGFNGIMVTTPKHLPAAHFYALYVTQRDQEIAKHLELLTGGVISIDGEMIGPPHVKLAQQRIRRSQCAKK